MTARVHLVKKRQLGDGYMANFSPGLAALRFQPGF